MNRKLIEQGVNLLLRGMEIDTTDHNFADTPRRVADVYAELFTPPESGYPVFDEDYTDIVLLRGHTFYTLCPHHLLPVRLVASLAYIPNGKVLGASKLMRLMHECNKFPMTQERLTAMILERLNELTSSTASGGAIKMVGEHGCFAIRGVKSTANMVTVKYRGVFHDDLDLQRRFLDLVG